jgi:hypothetical protein
VLTADFREALYPFGDLVGVAHEQDLLDQLEGNAGRQLAERVGVEVVQDEIEVAAARSAR